jgi:hypothetical protein
MNGEKEGESCIEQYDVSREYNNNEVHRKKSEKRTRQQAT